MMSNPRNNKSNSRDIKSRSRHIRSSDIKSSSCDIRSSSRDIKLKSRDIRLISHAIKSNSPDIYNSTCYIKNWKILNLQNLFVWCYHRRINVSLVHVQRVHLSCNVFGLDVSRNSEICPRFRSGTLAMMSVLYINMFLLKCNKMYMYFTLF